MNPKHGHKYVSQLPANTDIRQITCMLASARLLKMQNLCRQPMSRIFIVQSETENSFTMYSADITVATGGGCCFWLFGYYLSRGPVFDHLMVQYASAGGTMLRKNPREKHFENHPVSNKSSTIPPHVSRLFFKTNYCFHRNSNSRRGEPRDDVGILSTWCTAIPAIGASGIPNTTMN